MTPDATQPAPKNQDTANEPAAPCRPRDQVEFVLCSKIDAFMLEFIRGELPEEIHQKYSHHVDTCERCRNRLFATLAVTDELS